MDPAARIHEAQARQRLRGRLRWLLDDFGRRPLGTPLRPGELLDLGDDVLGFVDAGRHGALTVRLSQEEIQRIQGDLLGGLKALFAHQPWRLYGQPLEVQTRVDALATAKMPRDAVDHTEGMVRRLWGPLRLYASAPSRERLGDDDVRRLFAFEAAQEVIGKWESIGCCPRCAEFFYRIRRQVFCSPGCKQEAMDERKRSRRSKPKKKGAKK